MDKNQKLLLLFIGFCMLVVIGVLAYNVFMPKPEIKPDDVQVSERSVAEEVMGNENTEKKEDKYVNIYFMGRDENTE